MRRVRKTTSYSPVFLLSLNYKIIIFARDCSKAVSAQFFETPVLSIYARVVLARLFYIYICKRGAYPNSYHYAQGICGHIYLLRGYKWEPQCFVISFLGGLRAVEGLSSEEQGEIALTNGCAFSRLSAFGCGRDMVKCTFTQPC